MVTGCASNAARLRHHLRIRPPGFSTKRDRSQHAGSPHNATGIATYRPYHRESGELRPNASTRATCQRHGNRSPRLAHLAEQCLSSLQLGEIRLYLGDANTRHFHTPHLISRPLIAATLTLEGPRVIPTVQTDPQPYHTVTKLPDRAT